MSRRSPTALGPFATVSRYFLQHVALASLYEKPQNQPGTAAISRIER
jgi:hypothetical protein